MTITGNALDIIYDNLDKKYSFSQTFESIVTSRVEGKDGSGALLLSDIVWFSDGSNKNEGAVLAYMEWDPWQNFLYQKGSILQSFKQKSLPLELILQRKFAVGLKDKSKGKYFLWQSGCH